MANDTQRSVGPEDLEEVRAQVADLDRECRFLHSWFGGVVISLHAAGIPISFDNEGYPAPSVELPLKRRQHLTLVSESDQ